MSILPVMVLLSMLVVVGAGIAFFWAVDHDQFEDLQSPAFLPMMDDSAPASESAATPSAEPSTALPCDVDQAMSDAEGPMRPLTARAPSPGHLP